MRTKRFSKADFDRYDKAARVRTQQHLELTGHTVEPHPDRYAQDLIATKDGTSIYVECEVKVVWDGDTFPYDTVQLPQRKQKFFAEPTLFYIWNKQLDCAITFLSEDIKDLTPVEVPNRYVYKGEYFFQIPLDLTTRVKVRVKNEANT
jgi:hypothetical protein